MPLHTLVYEEEQKERTELTVKGLIITTWPIPVKLLLKPPDSVDSFPKVPSFPAELLDLPQLMQKYWKWLQGGKSLKIIGDEKLFISLADLQLK